MAARVGGSLRFGLLCASPNVVLHNWLGLSEGRGAAKVQSDTDEPLLGPEGIARLIVGEGAA
jgi:hypothetical protein